MVHPQQRNQPQGDGGGEGPKGAKGGGLPSQSAASMGVGMGGKPRKPHPFGIFQVGRGVGKMRSFVVFSQFQVKLRQGKRGNRPVCRKEIWDLLGPCGQGDPRFLSSWTNAGRKQGPEIRGRASSFFPSNTGPFQEAQCLQNICLK